MTLSDFWFFLTYLSAVALLRRTGAAPKSSQGASEVRDQRSEVRGQIQKKSLNP